MSELIIDDGNIMLDISVIKRCTPYIITGWNLEVAHGNLRVCQSNETHATLTSGSHKVFNTGKSLPKLENVEVFKFALAGQGILLN